MEHDIKIDFQQNNILDQLDILGNVKFDSVIERYYTKYYKRLTNKSISQDLFGKIDKENETECLDQFYFEHSNHLILFGIAQTHDLFLRIKEGQLDPGSLEIFFGKGKVDRSEMNQKISGKNKNNATYLD